MNLDTGSRWIRWDLHLHAPGTALNDQFAGDWDAYFDAIEGADPAAAILGVTDYCSLRCYEEFIRRWPGRASDVVLAIPNIEFRLTPRTSSGCALNAHLLVSPEDPNHITKTYDALGRLTASFASERIACSYKGLVALGRIHLGPDAAEDAAFREGVNQFKIDVTPFVEWYNSEPWLRRNSLLGMAGGNDGLSGLRRDDSFRQKHDELVRIADFLFSAQPSDRSYYLGNGPESRSEIETKYGKRKPCIHGSDAHRIQDVLRPDLDRICWIKAAPSFDGLRQILYEPDDRVHIGDRSPPAPDQDRVIESVTITNGKGWFESSTVFFNDYLTAIIGEKGTGKTALADLLAVGGGAWANDEGSFLRKAWKQLYDVNVTIRWASGRAEERSPSPDGSSDPQIMYLSQHFVERLCSGDLMAEELIDAVESIIFDHIPTAERLNTGTFADLRKAKTVALQEERADLHRFIVEANERVQDAQAEIAGLAKRRKAAGATEAEVARLTTRLNSLVSADKRDTAKKVQELNEQLGKLEAEAGRVKGLLEKLRAAELKIDRVLQGFSSTHAELSGHLKEIGLTDEEIAAFQPRFTGDTSAPLARAKRDLEAELDLVTGTKDPKPGTIAAVGKVLAEENEKLKLDKARELTVKTMQRDQSRLRSQLQQEKANITRIDKLQHDELPVLKRQRMEAYLRYFHLLWKEHGVLEELYRPLTNELHGRSGEAERDLTLAVTTVVDIDKWAERGEAMLDLRRSHLFSGRGALKKEAGRVLREAWASGEAKAIAEGVNTIISGILDDVNLHDLLRVDYTPRDIADWLFSVEHIWLDYTLKYKGTELKYLSPGTRGIVLLILYLAVDQLDNRPLLIDQPEENLDNASVYDVLVHYFRAAKRRRQIIIVTHNPNLVVNTDAEQIVVTTANRRENGLPMIKYESGPIEHHAGHSGVPIRQQVCSILEGGRDAFQMREARYALRRTTEW